jgi:glycosyltransferase involved in cell wall biosynthesis
MKILYDYQTFTIQQYGGISRYFFELIKRFHTVKSSCSVGAVFSNNAYLNKNTYEGIQPFFPNNNFKGKDYLYTRANQFKSLKDLKVQKFDVFHPTYYNDYFLNHIGKKPFVVTFYDMIHEKFHSQYSELSNDMAVYNFKRKLAEKAERIIAISETTKNDIIDIYGIDENKIDVVYLGNSLESAIVGEKRIVEQEYILFVGNRSLYKNFEGFTTVVADQLKANCLLLVCAGGGAFSEQEMDFIKKMNLDKSIVHVNKIDDSILSNLYSNALFFAFPSLYEGFGIPVLESFASNCPTLLSTGGSLPEIGGEAAVYFDPNDQHSLYSAVENLISSTALRTEKIQKGEARVKEFSWDKTFQETMKIYKQIT